MYNRILHPPIIYFHSVAPAKDPRWIKSYLTTEFNLFEKLIQYIIKKGLRTFFISEMDQEEYTVKNSIGLSFDDGYLDNYVYVFPLLKKYSLKATIFCSTDFIDPRDVSRPTLEDVWNLKIEPDRLESLGFCSWRELSIMEQSGLVDIQSHTVTHDKIPVSERIVDFHHPGNTNINFLLHNLAERKPYYIADQSFTRSLPYGYPIFEEKSAVVSPRVWINEEFIEGIVDALKNQDWNSYEFSQFYSRVHSLVESFNSKKTIIEEIESNDLFMKRVEEEILCSKEILGQKLSKEISVICWPNGDFNQISVELARTAGYKKILYVENKDPVVRQGPDHFMRTGMRVVKNKPGITMLKTKSRIHALRKVFPFYQIARLYRFLRY